MTDRFLAMSDAEMERRWALVRALLADRGLDALLTLASDDETGGYVRWLTDGSVQPYRRGVLICADGEMAVVEHGFRGQDRPMDGRDPHYRGVTRLKGVAEFPAVDYSLGYEAGAMVTEIRRRGLRKLGLAGTGNMPHRFVTDLMAALSEVAFLNLTDEMDGFMVVKSAEEQQAIRRNAALQDDLITLALGNIRPGILESELTGLLRSYAQERGAEGGIILAGSGPAGTFAPFKPIARQNRRMEKGDIVSLLVENSGPGGWFTEVARNFTLGKADEATREAVAAATEMQHRILAAFVPGTPCADIAARHDKDRAGYGLPPEGRIFAHGQGYNLVERPLIRSDEPMEVKAGMNLAIHPTVADPAKGLFAIMCDNYIVTENGPGPRLHRTEQRLFEIC